MQVVDHKSQQCRLKCKNWHIAITKMHILHDIIRWGTITRNNSGKKHLDADKLH